MADLVRVYVFNKNVDQLEADRLSANCGLNAVWAT